jgi:hypothetical protein
MRKLRLLVLIALAGFAWKQLQPRLPALKAQVRKIRGRVEPAVHQAADGVRSVSKNAAESVRDLSLTAAETAESVRDTSISAAATADSVATAIGVPEAADTGDGTGAGRDSASMHPA